MSIDCPHCRKSIGGQAVEGGLRLRLGIILIDPTDGQLHGPCPHCKQDVVVAGSSNLAQGMRGSRRILPGLLVRT